MDIKSLKQLSSSRILNMKQVYEMAGISTASMNSRLSTLTGKLTQEEQNALELAIIEQIIIIQETLGLSKAKIANALDIPYENSHIIYPMCYLKHKNQYIPIFLREDRLAERTQKSGCLDPVFYSKDQVLDMLFTDNRIEITDRGQAFKDKYKETAIEE